MKAIIIDDEPLARNLIKEYLQDYPMIELVKECSDGFEGVKAIAEFDPDLIFLDIQMPKITGFEMLELIDREPEVIFTTAFDTYAVKAFESSALDYLLKPFSKDRFDKAIKKLLEKEKKEPISDKLQDLPGEFSTTGRIVVKDAGTIKIIPVQKVIFIEAADDYVKIHTADGKFLKKKTLSFFENALKSFHFVRVHRSYLINTNFITRIEPYEKEGHLALLSGGNNIPVSRVGYTKLKEVLGI